MLSPIYVVDTNVLIQAYRNYYSFDLAPGFWFSLTEFAERIRVIDWVRNEMVDKHDDELAQWVRGTGAVLCQPVMELDHMRSAVVAEYQAISTIVRDTPRFKDRGEGGVSCVCRSLGYCLCQGYRGHGSNYGTASKHRE